VNTSAEIRNELLTLQSRLAHLPPLMPYPLPDPAYFRLLPVTLTDAARADQAEDPILVWSREMPFITPEGYFDGLAAQLASSISSADLPSALESPFALPEGYFANLPGQLVAAAKAADVLAAPKTPKRIPLLRRSLPWLAAAAVMSGVWFGVTRDSAPMPAATDTRTALTQLPDDTIGVWLEQHVDEFDPETLENMLAAGSGSDVKKSVSELRDEEIEDYLNDAESEAMASDGI
jgi:hypothetical protein